MVWEGGVYKGKKKNPSGKEMWCLSHNHAALVYRFSVTCISETVSFCFLRECIKTELFCTKKKKKILTEVNRALLQKLFNLLALDRLGNSNEMYF